MLRIVRCTRWPPNSLVETVPHKGDTCSGNREEQVSVYANAMDSLKYYPGLLSVDTDELLRWVCMCVFFCLYFVFRK